MGKFIIDTNVLLSYPEIFKDNVSDKFIIHSVVVEELDNQVHNRNNNAELAYRARRARNAIKDSEGMNVEYSVHMNTSSAPLGWDATKNDNIILFRKHNKKKCSPL